MVPSSRAPVPHIVLPPKRYTARGAPPVSGALQVRRTPRASMLMKRPLNGCRRQ
jgi:hypothetical protein